MLSPGPANGLPYPLGRFRYDEASNGIRSRATSDDLYVPGMRTVGGLILPRGLIDSRKVRSSGSNRHAGRIVMQFSPAASYFCTYPNRLFQSRHASAKAGQALHAA